MRKCGTERSRLGILGLIKLYCSCILSTHNKHAHTFFTTFLACAVDVIFELDADLSLSGLVSDERVLQQLFCGWTTWIRLHKTALDEVNELLRPERDSKT